MKWVWVGMVGYFCFYAGCTTTARVVAESIHEQVVEDSGMLVVEELLVPPATKSFDELPEETPVVTFECDEYGCTFYHE